MSDLPAGLSIRTMSTGMAIFHDGTDRWLPIHFGDDERLVPLVAPYLAGIDWTVNPDDPTDADRGRWLDAARAAVQGACKVVDPIVERWEYARDEAAWEACDERGLCRACAEPYGDDVDAHLDDCLGHEALETEMIEAKLGLTPPAREIPEQVTS